MSEHYQLNFDFGLDPYGPDAWPRAFLALAGGHPPVPADLAALPALVRHYLGGGDWFPVAGRVETIGSLVRMTRHAENPPFRDHARDPLWTVQFSICMHDDEYMNRGYGLFAAIAEMTGRDGLFCVETIQGVTDRVTHFYREHKDVLIVNIKASSAPPRLAPDSTKTFQEAFPNLNPATEASFYVEKVYRIPGEELRSWCTE